MRFQLHDGEMVLQRANNILEDMNKSLPISTALIVDIPNIKESIGKKSKNILKTPMVYSVTPAIGSTGVFWHAFLTYIFPWILDIGKVYCCIRVAQAFYQERRGGRDEGTGIQALLVHGKWYLALWLLPWGVELIDGIGHTMFDNLRQHPVEGLNQETLKPQKDIIFQGK